jgi:radical SAM protein with 4Fe4S-binding SPASM domain
MILLSRLLQEGRISEDDIVGADLLDQKADWFLALTPRASVKRLEEDYLYHAAADELYEINDDALKMLLLCDGSRRTRELGPDPGFLSFSVQEDLLEFHEQPHSVELAGGRSPIPSLRYLEWLVTFRCNLSCAHCYLGEAGQDEFPVELIRPLLEQFTRMQGLRILVSGGEPTLYRHFSALNEAIRDYPIRAVLLTNGLTMTEEFASGLSFHEVQVSLDGMEHGHEAIRGKGSFRKAVQAMRAVRSAGLDLSVATMIHRGNLDQWEEMQELVTRMGAREWNIDYPCVKGRWEEHPELAVDPETAARKMGYGFGGSYHGTSPGWTCGRHLAAVLPSGELCRCGLYPERCYGSVRDGLELAWRKVEHIPISSTQCAGCEHADTCGGGCRFRAGGSAERDLVMCRLHAVD